MVSSRSLRSPRIFCATTGSPGGEESDHGTSFRSSKDVEVPVTLVAAIALLTSMLLPEFG